MIVQTYACEICRKQRSSDSNHWFHGHILRAGIVLLHWDEDLVLSRSGLVQDGADAHLCGSQHALQWLSAKLGERSTDAQI